MLHTDLSNDDSQELKFAVPFNLIKGIDKIAHFYLKNSDLNNPKNLTNQHFQMVYDAAVVQDEKQLSRLVSQQICINVHKGIKTPIQQLAKEGQNDAVNLLIKEYYGDINEAVYGAEQGGEKNLDLAESLILKGASLNSAVRGAAEVGNILRVKELLRRGAEPNYALWGEATGGHFWNEVGNLERKIGCYEDLSFGVLHESLACNDTPHCMLVKNLLQNKAKIKFLFLGAGQGNHLEMIQNLIQENFFVDRHYGYFADFDSCKLKCITFAIEGACEAGNIGLYNYLRSQCKSSTILNRDYESHVLPNSIFAAARSGDFSFAKFLSEKCYDKNPYKDGCLSGGHYLTFRQYIKKESDYSLRQYTNQLGCPLNYNSYRAENLPVKNLFESGQFQLINELSHLYKNIHSIEITPLSKNIYFENDASALHSLSQIHNVNLREVVAKAANKMRLLPQCKRMACKKNENISPLSFIDKKNNLLNDLSKSFITSGVFFPDFRYKKLKQRCQIANCDSAIKVILNTEKNKLKEKDAYSDLIDWYLNSFKSFDRTQLRINTKCI